MMNSDTEPWLSHPAGGRRRTSSSSWAAPWAGALPRHMRTRSSGTTVELEPLDDAAIEAKVPRLDKEQLDEMVCKHDSLTSFRWRLALVLLFPFAFIFAGLAHAAHDRAAIAAGATTGELGVNGYDLIAVVPIALLLVALHVWAARVDGTVRLLLPRRLSALLNPHAEQTNIVAWFLRAGSQQYAILWSVVLQGVLALTVPPAIAACQRAVTMPANGSLPAEPCLTTAYQVPNQFEEAACQPCVDIVLYVTNTALYSLFGSALVYATVLAVAPTLETLQSAQRGLKDLREYYPLGNAMVTQSERYARATLARYEHHQGTAAPRIRRILFLFISLSLFFVALFVAVRHRVSAKLEAYADLPINLAVPGLWVSVAIASLSVVLSITPLTDLVIYIVPSCIEHYVEPQVVNFTAYINPVLRLGLSTTFGPGLGSGGTTSMFGNSAEALRMHDIRGAGVASGATSPELPRPGSPAAATTPTSPEADLAGAEAAVDAPAPAPAPALPPSPSGSRRTTPRHSATAGEGMPRLARTSVFSSLAHLPLETRTSAGSTSGSGVTVVLDGGRVVQCPIATVSDATQLLIACEQYLYNWVAARRYQQRLVLSSTLAPVAVLILVIFLLGTALSLVLLIGFLIPNQFRLASFLHPAAILTLYTSVYALISSTLVAISLIRLVDQTTYQVRPRAACGRAARGAREYNAAFGCQAQSARMPA